MNWYLDVLKKYAVFSGRARRKEYWMYTLFNTIAVVVLAVIDFALSTYPLLVGIYVLAVLVPSLAVAVRRLHDTGRSGWWYLISFVPLVGGIILLVFTVLEGESHDNAYGSNPKAVSAY
ncbi:DUF805 domain-containing protein [Streptomyces sp. ISL-36]|uniref:DUF805 domain-containing protein n=1 Tax=Streptomyces sp. ISL-36 TaxID=2819182 RepID=UPI001BEAE68B|nr:DUF805 domain-containing protein [Streptomyces sp. ISL-36]MBT2443263.1 DUF805 domain-containing protein [Streptomyces sp. ISL-36]